MTTATFTGIPEEIQVFQDNHLTLDVTVLTDAGAAFDLTNYVGVFTLKDAAAHRDSLALLQKETDKPNEGSITIAGDGTMQFLLDRTDTDGLKPGVYTWDIVVFDSANLLKYTVLYGSMRILQGVLHGVPAPTITTAAVPDNGVEAGGTLVVIGGTGFQTGVGVTFDGVTATAIVRDSAVQITCNTPAGTGVVDIVVTNPDAQLATDSGGFTYT